MWVGGGFVCAQRNDLSLACWGRGDFGQLGNEKDLNIGDEPGEMGNALLPVQLGFGIVYPFLIQVLSIELSICICVNTYQEIRNFN